MKNWHFSKNSCKDYIVSLKKHASLKKKGPRANHSSYALSYAKSHNEKVLPGKCIFQTRYYLHFFVSRKNGQVSESF